MGYQLEDYGEYDSKEEASTIPITNEVIRENEEYTNEIKSKEISTEDKNNFSISDQLGRTIESNEEKVIEEKKPEVLEIKNDTNEEPVVLKKIVEEPEELSPEENNLGSEDTTEEESGKKKNKKKH